MLTQGEENGWDGGQVEHGAPRSGRDDNIDHESSDNADADDELIDAAQRPSHLCRRNLHTIQPMSHTHDKSSSPNGTEAVKL